MGLTFSRNEASGVVRVVSIRRVFSRAIHDRRERGSSAQDEVVELLSERHMLRLPRKADADARLGKFRTFEHRGGEQLDLARRVEVGLAVGGVLCVGEQVLADGDGRGGQVGQEEDGAKQLGREGEEERLRTRSESQRV